jgi:hypothetical protein
MMGLFLLVLMIMRLHNLRKICDEYLERIILLEK